VAKEEYIEMLGTILFLLFSELSREPVISMSLYIEQ